MIITLKYLVLTLLIVNLAINDKYCNSNGITANYFYNLYIRDAGGLSHWDQYLSLSTAFRHSYFQPLLTSKDNDTMEKISRLPYSDRLKRIRSAMINRCENEKNINYSYYGGRGISICYEWRYNFREFYEWAINNGYTEDFQLDRINVNGNYEPDNCRWVSRLDNMRNRRGVIKITYQGQEQSLIEVTGKLGIRHSTVYQLVRNFNYTPEEAIERCIEKKSISDKKKLLSELKDIIDSSYVFYEQSI